MIKKDKIDYTLASIALKEALIEDNPLDHILVKYDIENIDDALLRVKRHMKLKSTGKNKPIISVANVSTVPSRINNSRTL